MLIVQIDLLDFVVGFVILSFFFKQLKKKGDDETRFSRLDSICKIILVFGKNNNVNINKDVNIKK